VYIPRRLLLSGLVVILVAGSLVFALSASADRGGGHQGAPFFASSLAPSQPAPTDPTIHGVAPGSLPWALTRGSVVLRDDGRISVDVDGLVITSAPFTGTPGPVTGITASLFCGPDSNTTAAATTAVAPVNSDGDATIRADITLPSTCLAPIVVINPVLGVTAKPGTYIAISGFMG